MQPDVEAGVMPQNAAGEGWRVLMVIRWPVGGIRTFLRYVCNCFDAGRYRFTILAPDLPETRFLEADLARLDCRLVLTESQPTALGLARQVARQVRRERFDLVYSQGITSGLCSALPALRAGIPHLLTCHELLSREQFAGLSGRATKALLSGLLPWLDCIHVVSHDARDNLLENVGVLKALHREIMVSRNGIDVEQFLHGPARDFRRELGLPPESFLIGFLGRFMKVKGFRYLLEALELLQARPAPPRPPVLLAIGSGGFVREEQTYVRERGLEALVRFLPFEPDIAAALRGLDVVVMPSLQEACGLLAMEAMVAGVPIIGSSCHGLREVLQGTPSCMVPPADSAALAEALVREIANPGRGRAERFRREAAVRFNVAEQARLIDQQMTRLIRRARQERS